MSDHKYENESYLGDPEDDACSAAHQQTYAKTWNSRTVYSLNFQAVGDPLVTK